MVADIDRYFELLTFCPPVQFISPPGGSQSIDALLESPWEPCECAFVKETGNTGLYELLVLKPVGYFGDQTLNSVKTLRLKALHTTCLIDGQ